MRVPRALLACSVVVLALASAPAAMADIADEQALAERFAPVVRIVDQAQECGYGEAYGPISVDLVLDEPTVALRGPWNTSDLIEIGRQERHCAIRPPAH